MTCVLQWCNEMSSSYRKYATAQYRLTGLFTGTCTFFLCILLKNLTTILAILLKTLSFLPIFIQSSRNLVLREGMHGHPLKSFLDQFIYPVFIMAFTEYYMYVGMTEAIEPLMSHNE